jgi:hypothetical protein
MRGTLIAELRLRSVDINGASLPSHPHYAHLELCTIYFLFPSRYPQPPAPSSRTKTNPTNDLKFRDERTTARLRTPAAGSFPYTVHDMFQTAVWLFASLLCARLVAGATIYQPPAFLFLHDGG